MEYTSCPLDHAETLEESAMLSRGREGCVSASRGDLERDLFIGCFYKHLGTAARSSKGIRRVSVVQCGKVHQPRLA